MKQLNISIRVSVPIIDLDRPSANITQREVKAILCSTFKGAVRGGKYNVTMWDNYGHRLAHRNSDPQAGKPKGKTLVELFGKG